VHGLLYSANWDTRTAAAATIGLLAEAFPHHSISQLAAAGTAQASDAQQLQQLQELQQGIHITLQSFDLSNVLSKGEPLLASGGQVGCSHHGCNPRHGFAWTHRRGRAGAAAAVLLTAQ
jgi:hypothetical protein